MDANFNAQLQVTQLEALRMQKPDAIIGVPVDENITAGKFKELSRLTKMILIGNIPQGIDKNDVGCSLRFSERAGKRTKCRKYIGGIFQGRERMSSWAC